MGNGSSQAIEDRRRANWSSATLPRDMAMRTPNMKRLPGLGEAVSSGGGARLRSTDNGAILHSGGTISGRRPSGGAATLPPPAGFGSRDPNRPSRRSEPHLMINGHMGIYRSRSVSSPDPASGLDCTLGDRMPRPSGISRRERDPLHRAHGLVEQSATSGDFGQQSKKFGSEPNLRGTEEVTKSKIMKHFRKKYRAPQPPIQADRDGSSPDSFNWKDGKPPDQPPPPSRKMRLFKTRAESKKQLQYNINSNGMPCKNLDNRDNATESSCYSTPERRFRTPSREKEYKVGLNDENPERGAFRASQGNSSRNKISKQMLGTAETKFMPNFSKAFRYSERFRKEADPSIPALRREKSFDSSLMEAKDEKDGVNRTNINRRKLLDQKNRDRLDDRLKRSSLPQLSQNMSNDNFQKELMLATNKIRNQFKRLSDDKSVPVIEQTSHVKKPIANGPNISLNSNRLSNVRESSRKGAAESSSQIKNRNIKNAVRDKLLSKNDDVKPSRYDVKTLDVKRESRPLADRGQASGKESTPEQSPSRVKEEETLWDRSKQTLPSKQFYFGMGNESDTRLPLHTSTFPGIGQPTLNYEDRQIMHKTEHVVEVNAVDMKKYADKNDVNGSSESALSSEPEIDDRNSDENNPHGIDLKLRPMLPKKQLEIPRFSPAAAWRQLAALEAEQTDRTGVASVSEDSGCPPITNCESSRLRSSHDKSGDSGISGDAPPDVNHDDRLDSPHGHEFTSSPTRPHISNWTPQQDLEEESSSDQGVDSPSNPPSDNTPAKFSARNPIFSLSLPRESNHHSLTEKNKQQTFNSLQKLKKSMTGAFGALGSRKLEEDESEETTDQNWFLSRSAPNSLNNGLQYNHRRVVAVTSNDSGNHQTPPSSDQEEERERVPPVIPSILRQQPQFSYLSTGGHVMYLPEYDSKLAHRQNGPSSFEQPYSFSLSSQHKDKGFFATLDRLTEREDSFDNLDLRNKEVPRGFREEKLTRAKSSGEIELRSRKSMVHTNSCEDLLNGEMIETGGRKDLQTIHRKQELSNKPAQRTKGKRFTFQSTVRQIERRRLAEKLSREAEQKERQRLSELEAMRRVEEEFQRKRAREKASIRQQLRLVTGAVNGQGNSDLPTHWDDQPRLEPEGAASLTSLPDASPPDRQSPYVSRLAAMRSAGAGSGARKSRPVPARTSDSGSDAGSRREQPLHQPPATKVLSEYKVAAEQPARQYRDYTSRLSSSSSGGGTPPVNGSPPAVQHPQACYNMPRATHVYVAAPPQGGNNAGGASPTSLDNYRLQFARGAAASSSGSGSEASGSRGAPTRPRDTPHRAVHQPPAIPTVSGRLRW